MAFPWLAVMAGLQAIKMGSDVKKEQNDRYISSLQTEWQPFTGQAPQQIRRANPWGDLANTVMTAGMMDQNAADAEWKKNMSERQVSAFEKMAGVGNTTQNVTQAAADLPPWAGASKSEIANWQKTAPVAQATQAAPVAELVATAEPQLKSPPPMKSSSVRAARMAPVAKPGGSSWESMLGMPSSTQDLPPWGSATDDEIRRWQMSRY